MSKNSRFFESDRQAAAILKHGILNRYLSRFVGMVGSRSLDGRVGYIDGFAGSGEYVHPVTGRRSPGSPKIALEIAAKEENRQLECTFIELKSRQFATLKSVVEESGNLFAIALEGDVRAHLQQALARYESLPLLVFLDPFGTSLETGTVVDIMRRHGDKPTEVLLNFSVESVRRIGGRLFEKAGAPGRQASLKRMDNWLGGDWWRAIFLATDLDGVQDRVNLAADRVYVEYVRRVNHSANSRAFTVPIRRQPHHLPIFYLVLFYRRNYAVLPFNEAVSMATQDWRFHLQDLDLTAADREEYRQPTLTGLSLVEELKAVFLDDEIAFKQGTIDTIAGSIRSSLANRNHLSVSGDFPLIFGDAVGVGRDLHLRAAWDQLAAEGVIVARQKSVSLASATIRRRRAGVEFR
jgi:three-Cys-motif partner protein